MKVEGTPGIRRFVHSGWRSWRAPAWAIRNVLIKLLLRARGEHNFVRVALWRGQTSHNLAWSILEMVEPAMKKDSEFESLSQRHIFAER